MVEIKQLLPDATLFSVSSSSSLEEIALPHRFAKLPDASPEQGGLQLVFEGDCDVPVCVARNVDQRVTVSLLFYKSSFSQKFVAVVGDKTH